MAGVLTASWAGGSDDDGTGEDGGDGGAPDGRGIDSIPKVVAALVAVRDASAANPRQQGIAAFSTLYEIITRNVLETAEGTAPELRFADPDFLIELDVQFARRYLAAVRRWEEESERTPDCWRILFDSDGGEERSANHAAAGVNAHVNFDLALALLETWRTYPPNDERRADYDLVNDIFAREMDGLREHFPTAFAEVGEDGSPIDETGNIGSSILVRWTRGFAWHAAHRAWRHYDPSQPDGGADYRKARDRLEWWLDTFAHATGVLLLRLDAIP